MDLSGIWRTNDGTIYYLRQEENELWWLGENYEQQWFNIFNGLVIGESVEGEWVNTPKSKNRDYGKLILDIKGNKLVSLTDESIFKGFEWKKENMIGLLTNPASNKNQFLTAGYNEADNLTGGWIGNDSGFYYLREIGDAFWGLGEHPKRNWITLLKGICIGNIIKVDWIDLSKGKRARKGSVELEIDPNNKKIKCFNETGGFTCRTMLKLTGLYYPGELGFDLDYHPATWNIKWDGRSGLNYEAYDCIFRAPYIQNVTTDSASVIWRVGLPIGTNPEDIIDSIKAEALLSLRETPIANGDRYSIRNGIEATDCSWTYDSIYPKGISKEQNRSIKTKNSLQLTSLHQRPTIQFRVRFTGLQPGKVYHYRIKSDLLDPIAALSKEDIDYLTIANDISFKTADLPQSNRPVRFLAMSDLGPGKGRPNFYYDVFDLFHDVVRTYSPDFWLAPGDLEKYWGGHPNAMDPFFFNVYNAYLNRNFGIAPRWTSASSEKAKDTKVKAFQKPPYYGILGGLPVYPAVGDDDLKGGNNNGSLENWRKSYLSNFELPREGSFNRAGNGFFYTFRYGDVILVSLAIPGPMGKFRFGIDWWNEWGSRQINYLKAYLSSLKEELSNPNTWLIVYFHDYHWGYSPSSEMQLNFSRLLAALGVDLAIMGNQHCFAHKTIRYGGVDYRAVVVGAGGFGAVKACKRPGFIMANIYQDTLEYWKFDSHNCGFQGEPENRDALAPMVREYCVVKKLGYGKHEVKEMDLNAIYHFKV